MNLNIAYTFCLKELYLSLILIVKTNIKILCLKLSNNPEIEKVSFLMNSNIEMKVLLARVYAAFSLCFVCDARSNYLNMKSH